MVSIRGPIRAPATDDGHAAVAELYSLHWAGLVRLAVLMTDDRQAAEDIVQEAFTELYRRWPLREADAALGYLRAAILNRSRSVLRRRRVARLYTPPHHAPNPSAETTAVLGEERSQVQRALQGLPTRTRQVLVLRYYLDLPFAEIAALMGITESTARSASTRGLATLTERLKDLR
ncbi:sigma-70 family RNA polymerase sigma factor [Kribbella sp. NPDC048915]|uniref:RNA polymerase sigma factor n=1 Tax=Kribbella sp. NPDC048915 TaxID=3155148 RepID=UPI003404FF03